MMPQTYQEGMKRFTTHLKLSGESKVALKQALKWLERVGKGTGLGVFLVFR